MKTTTLDKILTPQQQDDLLKILNSTHQSQDDLIKKLKAFMHEHRAYLEAKEIDPDYLAYAVAYGVMNKVIQ